MKRLILIFFIIITIPLYSQNVFPEEYDKFRTVQFQNYTLFRSECNREYVDFLKTAWDWYEGKTPIPIPKEKV
ncbi:MAG: hypothetical protein K2N03_08190, partial [Muribaculaceae bacterium]|nr:hypothetical protein [Muribaculaceae bacterium]